MIVGSANASINGLGDEGNGGNIEAALTTDSTEILEIVRCWFVEQWKSAEPVTPALIKKAIEAWKIRAPIGKPGETFLQAFARDQSKFSDVTLLSYSEYPDDDAQATFQEQAVAKNQYSKIEIEQYRAAQDRDYGKGSRDCAKGPFYQADQSQGEFTGKPGDYIIDCNGDGGIPVFVSQIRRPGTIPISAKDCIVLMEPDTMDIYGLKFSKKDRKAVAAAVQEYKELHNKKDDDIFFSMDGLPKELLALIEKHA